MMISPYIFTALLSLLLVTCFTQNDQEKKHSQLCNHLKYDGNKYTCCDGFINAGSRLACCGSRTYDALTGSCCNNVTTEGVSQNVSKCCGSEAYNPLNQICCRKRILKRTSVHSICCHSEQYEEKTHLCCGWKNKIEKLNISDKCCGATRYNGKDQRCCFPKVRPLNETCDQSERHDPETTTRRLDDVEHLPCDVKTATQACSQSPDHRGEEDKCHICCSGVLTRRKSDLSVCCGTKVFELSDRNVLCCDGVLHRDPPAGSRCLGGTTYSPRNYTVCNRHAHLPAGQQCCGKNTFDPTKTICCSGHSHAKYKDEKLMSCCGSRAFDPSEHKCCSGHLHPTSDPTAECCGAVLMSDLSGQQCCSSDEKALVYKALRNHSCCGHWYHDVTLWSCCAHQLIPGAQNNGSAHGAIALRPHTDYSISTICNSTVLVATVQSEAMKESKRVMVLTNVMRVQHNRVVLENNTQVVEHLDHCRLPLLEKGRTYLWNNTGGDTWEPLSAVHDLGSVLHTLLNLCSGETTRRAA